MRNYTILVIFGTLLIIIINLMLISWTCVLGDMIVTIISTLSVTTYIFVNKKRVKNKRVIWGYLKISIMRGI